MPKLFIIIPVCNVSPYLRAYLDSVWAQTLINWEAICVDDGSTDGSGAILDEYAIQDSRFRVTHQQNAGATKAREVGLMAAHGEYVGWNDSDDAVASVVPASLEIEEDCAKNILENFVTNKKKSLKVFDF